ncbi:hypothetical protein FLB61_05485 [Sellimonas caecigallum]|uniref:Uncharacterized protein n=1 Tax=Sellimonas caecigallum TaxID=2592333 RepID=A0ABS7L671_9FIRM|nr:hypothetical protein [Sellimonas caecigallum]
MHEQIQDIQNSIWKAYKDFSLNHDMNKYNTDVQKIVKKYRSNPLMLNFCQNLIITWIPVINSIRDFKKSEKD